MANYKVLDADQLDADLKSVADTIRAKGGTSAQLAFPGGFNSAVNAITTGVTVQRASGTFTTDKDGKATVNCGFKPDFVVAYIDLIFDGYYDSIGAAFTDRDQKVSCTAWLTLDSAGSNSYPIMDALFEQTDNGFSVVIGRYDWDWKFSYYSQKLNYIAVKYT